MARTMDGGKAPITPAPEQVKEEAAPVGPGSSFGGTYKGVNATFRTPNGTLVEVQFHTPASFAMKSQTHKLYEELRDAGTSPARQKEIQKLLKDKFDTVPTPDGATKIGARGARHGGAAPASAEILPTPTVTDPKLFNYVKNLYKGTTNPKRVGNGTTADAVRHELATGQPVHGQPHLQKAGDTVRGLARWLKRNPDATPHDRRVAQSLHDELVEALGSTP